MSTTEQSGQKTAVVKPEPAKGKLGVMVVGLGAVATTMIAGVEAVRRGTRKADRLAHPDGHRPPRQAHRQQVAAGQGFCSARRLERHRLHRLGHLRRQRLRERRARQGARQGNCSSNSSPISKPSSRCPPSSTSSTSSACTAPTSRRARTSATSPSRCAPTFRPSERPSTASS